MRVSNSPCALIEGQRLDQAAFHALYLSMPPGTRAELIDGVVFMPRPVGLEHGEAHVPVIVWLDYYGLDRSAVYPGLWLDPQALVQGDRQRLRAVRDLGCATPEHAEFVTRLAARRDQV